MNNLVYPIIFSKNTVLICVNQCLNIIRENSWNLLLKNFSVNSVAINKSVKSAKSASKINAFYAKQTQISAFFGQKPRFGEKTNPKQTQTNPNCKTDKMNLYPLFSKSYEKIRRNDRNENKPKIYHGEAQRRRTNPNFIRRRRTCLGEVPTISSGRRRKRRRTNPISGLS